MMTYSGKALLNFRENERFAILMVYTQPKAAFCFRLLAILSLLFAISAISFVASFFVPIPLPGMGGTTMALLMGFVYLFKTLSEITKEREAEIIIKEGKAWLR